VGLVVALIGEAIRTWAAGHLEKSREVTRSGPYRWTQHPLYVGSSLIALGVATAARSATVAILGALYLGITITAAVRTERVALEQAFGAVYSDYRESRGAPMTRSFSFARAMRNREYRALVGVLIGFVLLALRMIVHL
jgi:protein-S-isoprenylcysteine O-methyltransferase Ste14